MNRDVLNYTSPGAAPPRNLGREAMLVHTVVLAAGAVLVTGVMVLVVPRFALIFNDFKVPLPVVTRWVMGFSRWMTAGWGWLAVWLAVGVPAFVYFVSGFHYPVRNPRRALVWGRRLGFLALAAFVAVVAVALFLPMVALVGAVSR